MRPIAILSLLALLSPAPAAARPMHDQLVEGDPIDWLVPVSTRSCVVLGQPEVRVTPPDRGEGRIEITLALGGDCRGRDAGMGVALGTLPAGRYRVVVRPSAALSGVPDETLVVLPTSTDPGELPLDLRVRLAVADKLRPGHCFGMPSPDRELDLGHYAPRLVRQMRKAYPGSDDRSLRHLLRRAHGIGLQASASGAWTYRATDGACCSITELEGTVRLGAGSKIEVGEARVVRARNVPC